MHILLHIIVSFYIMLKLATIIFNILFMKNLSCIEVSNKWINYCKQSKIRYCFMTVVVILFSIPFYLSIISTYMRAEHNKIGV